MSTPRPISSKIVFGLFILLVISLGVMLPSIDVGFASLTPTDVIFPILAVAWVAAIAFGGERFRWRFEYWTFVFYLVALAISGTFSINPKLSFMKLAGSAYLVLLAVLTSNVVGTFDRLRITMIAWLIGAIIPLFLGILAIVLMFAFEESGVMWMLTNHAGAVPVGDLRRVSSTFVSPSMLCNYLTVTLVFALVAKRMRWIGRNVFVALTMAIAITAIFTASIALGGMFLAVGLWMWIDGSGSRFAKFGLTAGVAIAIAFLVIAPFALPREIASFSFEQLAPSSRMLVWQDAVMTFLADPFTGRGLGTAVANVTFQNYDGTMSLLTDAHNTFLSVAAQSGILGLVGIVWIIIAVLKTSSQKGSDPNIQYVRYCLGAAFVVAFVYDGLTSSFEDARHLWVLIGLILTPALADTEGSESNSLNSA